MVDVKELNPGQALESNVVTPNGRLILPRGIALTSEHISPAQMGYSQGARAEPGNRASGSQSGTGKQNRELSDFLNACNDIDEPATRAVYGHGVKRLAFKCSQGWTIPKKDPNLPVNDGNLLDSFVAVEFSLKDLVRHDVELSSFPDIYFKIHKAINSPNSTTDYLAGIISKDPGLSTKLLRIVNSPFYGLKSRVDSIPRAVALVGVNELSTLALGISAINAFKDIPDKLVDMRSFWTHSVAVGVLAKSWKLPQYLAHPLGGHHREDFFGSPMTAIVHLADFMAIAMAFSEKGSLIAPPLSSTACQTAGLVTEKLETILSGAEEEFENIVDIFFARGRN